MMKWLAPYSRRRKRCRQHLNLCRSFTAKNTKLNIGWTKAGCQLQMTRAFGLMWMSPGSSERILRAISGRRSGWMILIRVRFPKLYENGDWNNEISRDGQHILMRKVSGGKFNSKGKIKKGEKLYVFAHYRDEFGKIYYAFKGVFEVRTHRENRATFSLVCDTIRFDAGRTQPA